MKKPPSILDRAFNVRDIPSNPKVLLLNMAKLGNTSAQCFASQETLAAMCCCCKRSVRRALKYLRDHGFVTRIPNPKGSTDRYVLHFERWGGTGGQDGLPKGKNGPHLRGQNVRQNQNLNQNLNQGAAPGGSVANALGKALNGIADAIEKRDRQENGND